MSSRDRTITRRTVSGQVLPGSTITAALAVVVPLCMACGDSDKGHPTDTSPMTGSLVVSTTTTGDEIDADGYQVTIGGGDTRVIDPTGSLTFADLKTGIYVVELSGVAPNCEVNGSNRRSVTITENAATEARFAIACSLVFQSVSAGDGHTCGVTTRGTAYCWGSNDSGQLGDGTTMDSNVPVAVSGGLTFQSVSAGHFHSCGVTTTAHAYCWGHSNSGALGDGTSFRVSSVPVAVSGGLAFQSVSAGTFHTCGVTTAGHAYCWGLGERGRLGHGASTDSAVPVAVSRGFTFRSVSVGDAHSCGVTTAGNAYCWGWNLLGGLGNGTTTDSDLPVAVSGGLTFESVSGGNFLTCGLTTAGNAYCWGRNGSGELGDGTTAASSVPVPVAGVLAFQVVEAYSCGVTTVGDAYCWGSGDLGRLGDGAIAVRYVPSPVSGGLIFQSVSGGRWHACGLTIAGEAYCWGWNERGTLGDGTNTGSSVPVLVRVSS